MLIASAVHASCTSSFTIWLLLHAQLCFITLLPALLLNLTFALVFVAVLLVPLNTFFIPHSHCVTSQSDCLSLFFLHCPLARPTVRLWCMPHYYALAIDEQMTSSASSPKLQLKRRRPPMQPSCLHFLLNNLPNRPTKSHPNHLLLLHHQQRRLR